MSGFEASFREIAGAKQNQDETSHLLRMLKASRKQKIASGWSRKIGAGFIMEDITDVKLGPMSGDLLVAYSGLGHQKINVSELNLRENEETIKYLEAKQRKM